VIRDLTERKRSEAALRDSEERYRLLFDSNPLPMWVYDLETLAFIAVNDAAVHHYGYSRNECLAMTIRDIRPLEDVPALLSHVSRVTTGLGAAGVWRHCKKDGTLIDVEITSYVLTFAGRRTKLVLANDVTERKRAEEALRESESRYRALFEFAPDGILIADPRSYYLDANASISRMLGYPRNELIGLHASDIVAPAEIQHIEPALSAIKAYSDYHREWQFRRKDGSAFAGEASVTVMPDGNLLAVIRDITERKHAEAALQESEARFRSFMNNSATIAWMKDEQGRHVYISETFEKRHGAHMEDWQGKTDFEVWRHEVAEAFRRNDQDVLRSNQPMGIIEETKDTEDHLTYWLNFKFPFRDASGKRYIGGIGVDITERKEYERELEALATVSAASRSTQTRAEMLAVIMEQTMSLTHADGATIVLIDPQKGDMVVEAVRGELSALAGSRVPQGQGIAGRVIATGQPYITNDLPNDALIKFRQASQLKSFVSVPLVTPNGIIGALQIAGRTRFADSLLSVLISVADMAAGAIQRVSLYERSLAHARELSQAYEETLAGWARPRTAR
jgi:PAS domain S-box-containing protein